MTTALKQSQNIVKTVTFLRCNKPTAWFLLDYVREKSSDAIFLAVFFSRQAQRTKRKNDYSWSTFLSMFTILGLILFMLYSKVSDGTGLDSPSAFTLTNLNMFVIVKLVASPRVINLNRNLPFPS